MEAQLLKMSLEMAFEYDPVGNIAELGAMIQAFEKHEGAVLTKAMELVGYC